MKDKFSGAGTPFDFWEPPEGHEQRFRIRLEKQTRPRRTLWLRRHDWSKWFVAASILFLGLVWWWTQPASLNELSGQTSHIIQSMETKRTQWERMLKKELQTAGWDMDAAEGLPGAQKLIDDAFRHLQRLEEDYDRLQTQFMEGGHYRTLDAMIRNKEMQHRILTDLKQQLMELRNRQIYENRTHQS